VEPQVLRSRTIRECILKLLLRMFQAAPELAVAADHVYEGFSTSRLQYTRDDIDPELMDLIESGLVEAIDLPGPGAPGLPAKGYRITSAGRDFVRARFPWGKIDEFSGDQPA